MSVFSNRLKSLRVSKNVTQVQVAESIGLSESAYQHYERATREPTLSNITKLADFFDVSVDYLLGRTNYWHDNEGRIKVKIPPDILNLDTDALKKQLDALKQLGQK